MHFSLKRKTQQRERKNQQLSCHCEKKKFFQKSEIFLKDEIFDTFFLRSSVTVSAKDPFCFDCWNNEKFQMENKTMMKTKRMTFIFFLSVTSTCGWAGNVIDNGPTLTSLALAWLCHISWETDRCQFHQHFTSSFCTNFFFAKKIQT